MSSCISRIGEYSDHESDAAFCCQRCFAFDETGALARIRELEAEVERLAGVDVHAWVARTAEAVAKVAPCSCSAQRARAETAEAELEGIKRRDAEVGEDESWWVGGAWGDYGEAVVPLRILSYVVDGKLDEKVASIDPGFALTYAEQTARAADVEAKLAVVREYVVAVQNSPGLGDTGHHARWLREALAVLDGDAEMTTTRLTDEEQQQIDAYQALADHRFFSFVWDRHGPFLFEMLSALDDAVASGAKLAEVRALFEQYPHGGWPMPRDLGAVLDGEETT